MLKRWVVISAVRTFHYEIFYSLKEVSVPLTCRFYFSNINFLFHLYVLVYAPLIMACHVLFIFFFSIFYYFLELKERNRILCPIFCVVFYALPITIFHVFI